jgi:hypothetical protein
MPRFSSLAPFGQLEFSSKPSVFQNVYQSMVNSLGGQYDLTVGGHNEATVYARARGIARAKQALRRAGNQTRPMKTVELLPLQEQGYGLVPNETDTILTRQQSLAARMLLSRGATRENVETQLRAILGAAFVGYRTLAAGEVTSWPADPSPGPGTFPRVDGAVVAKYVRFVDPVSVVGVATVHYAALDPTQGTVSLTAGDVMTVQLETLGLAERVTVTSVGVDAVGQFFIATFANAHDIGASGIVGSVPVWQSTQRIAFIEVTSAAALSIETKRKVDDVMNRIARGVSQWALVQPTTAGATTMGPFTLGVSPLGAVPVGTVNL